MASYTFWLAAFLTLSSQCIDARSLKDCGDIDICFHDAVRAMDAAINKVVLDIIDVIEPMYQIMRITAKNTLGQGIQELDAVERGAIREVEDMKNEAEGNVDHCVVNEIKIKQLTEDARKATTRCVDSTLDSIDSYFDIGILKLYDLRGLVDILVLEFGFCLDDDCKHNVLGKVAQAQEDAFAAAHKIESETNVNMESSISSIEVRCMSAHRQALRIKLRDIVDDMEECITNSQ